VKFALAPFVDNALAVIGMIRGWFKDVGITIGPTPTGIKLDFGPSLAPLLTGDVDVGSGVPASIFQQLDNVHDVVNFALVASSTNQAVFAQPGSSVRTLDDFMAAGDSFEVAASKATAQLKGKKVAVTSDPSGRVWFDLVTSLGKLSASDMTVITLADAEILNVANAGGVDFAMPGGSFQIISLIQRGFKTVISEKALLQNMTDDRRFQLVNHTSYLTTWKYYNEHYDTILRLSSVIYRIMNAITSPDRFSYLNDELPWINANGGTTFAVDQLSIALDTLNNANRNFEQTAELFHGTSVWNVYNAEQKQLDTLFQKGTLKKMHNVSEAEGGRKVYDDLVSLRAQSEALLAKAGDGGNNADVLAAAKKQFAALNFLDSTRMLLSFVK